MILFNQFTSAIIQVLFFSLFPFLWYIVTHKSAKGFCRWLGIKPASSPPLKYMLGILIGFFFALVAPYMWLYCSGNLHYKGFTVESFRQSGWSIETILVILTWAIIQTSLSEEILFRGFLCKRLIHRFGEKAGNAIQAGLFGAIHILALPNKSISAMLVIVLLTGGIGYALGWLSYAKADGSILYGWAIHATVNILSPIMVFLFLLPK